MAVDGRLLAHLRLALIINLGDDEDIGVPRRLQGGQARERAVSIEQPQQQPPAASSRRSSRREQHLEHTLEQSAASSREHQPRA